MARQVTDTRNDDPLPGRQAYTKPVLRVFGPVGQLTQGGTGARSEAMSNGNASMSRNQQRA